MEKYEIYDAKQDERFRDYYIDIEEKRKRKLPDGASISYTYVHGGVKAQNLKFSFCFPEKEAYRGRFFQYLSPFPGPDEELSSLNRTGADDQIAFALLHGAYFVETNMCSGSPFGGMPDNTIVWKSSAAAAELSRVKAMELYGCDRPYGYVYGGSGGGYKTMACIENTSAWDGAVPYVIGSPVSLPNSITLHALGQRCLRHAFGKIVDALDAGGNGDPYSQLNEEEAAMLKEITAMGFPPRAWFIEAGGIIDDGSLPVLTPGVKMMDPSYFTDFWTVPGYEGTDKNSSAVRDRLQFKGVVKSVGIPGAARADSESEKETETKPEAKPKTELKTKPETKPKTELEAKPETKPKTELETKSETKSETKPKPETKPETEPKIDDRNGVDTAWKKQLADGKDSWIELEAVPEGGDLYLKGVTIRIESGACAGKQLLLGGITGNCVTIGMCFGMDNLEEVLQGIKEGDEITLDNSDYIAIQYYYRHQVPEDTSFHAFDQFRKEDGTPALPQRSRVLGLNFSGTGTVQNGNIQGKVIILQSLMDESTWPWCGDWYRKKIAETKGAEENLRLYYMDRCIHGDITAIQSGMVTNYVGALHQCLLDMSEWAEHGKEPLPSSNYLYQEGQILVPGNAAERKGIQAAVTLKANGMETAHVKAGEAVKLTAAVQVPEDAGEVTSVNYSFCGGTEVLGENPYPVKGTFQLTEENGIHGAVSEITHSYDAPGTYFAAVHITTQREGDAEEWYTQVNNLARVRIVVE